MGAAVASVLLRPTFFMLVAFVVTFLVTRLVTHMIRTGRGPFRDNTVGGVHIHHEVYGIFLLLGAGALEFAYRPEPPGGQVLAALFGAGAALTLDEFALWLHLDDVYWGPEGRRSVDAVLVAVVVGALLLIEAAPWDVDASDGAAVAAVAIAVNLLFIVIALFKGRIVLGILGLLVPLLAFVAAVRARATPFAVGAAVLPGRLPSPGPVATPVPRRAPQPVGPVDQPVRRLPRARHPGHRSRDAAGRRTGHRAEPDRRECRSSEPDRRERRSSVRRGRGKLPAWPTHHRTAGSCSSGTRSPPGPTGCRTRSARSTGGAGGTRRPPGDGCAPTSTTSAPSSARPHGGPGRPGRWWPPSSTTRRRRPSTSGSTPRHPPTCWPSSAIFPTTLVTALLIGHNPGVAELVDLLSGEDREMRTASIAVLSWDGGWTDAAADVAQLGEHVTPRG